MDQSKQEPISAGAVKGSGVDAPFTLLGRVPNRGTIFGYQALDGSMRQAEFMEAIGPGYLVALDIESGTKVLVGVEDYVQTERDAMTIKLLQGAPPSINYPGSLLYRTFLDQPPIASDSSDTYFVREGGSIYAGTMVFDASSGAGVTSFGHSAARIKDAMIKQICTMPYAHSGQWTSPICETAASMIVERAGVRFARGGVSFYSGGSEAIEAALKFAAQILSIDQKVTPIVSRRHSYHGNTIGALLCSDHPRAGFLNTVMFDGWDHDGVGARHMDAFAPSLDTSMEPEEIRRYTQAAVLSLGNQLKQIREDFDAKAIVIIETIGGTTVGIEPPTVSYLRGIRSVCDAYGAILIHDEVLSGNYRTGHLLASNYYGFMNDTNMAPDIAVLGKGITGGYFPMSAVLLSSRSNDIIKMCGRMAHTSTNQNHPIGCAAVCGAMLTYDEYLPQIRALSKYLLEEIIPELALCKHVKQLHGVGMLWGVRFDPDVGGLHLEVKRQLLAAGIACYTDGNMINGKGNMLMFAPPFNSHSDDLRLFVAAIKNLEL